LQRQGDRCLPAHAPVGDRPGAERREAADVARSGTRHHDARADHGRRHGPDPGLAVLLEGIRCASALGLELGGADATAAGRLTAMHLAEKAGLWTDERKAAAREVERRIQAGELTVVRLSFADQHGILRGKTLVAGEIAAAMKSGVGFSTTML